MIVLSTVTTIPCRVNIQKEIGWPVRAAMPMATTLALPPEPAGPDCPNDQDDPNRINRESDDSPGQNDFIPLAQRNVRCPQGPPAGSGPDGQPWRR
jgi:hypothetical protein